jgi:hypothetical protein
MYNIYCLLWLDSNYKLRVSYGIYYTDLLVHLSFRQKNKASIIKQAHFAFLYDEN